MEKMALERLAKAMPKATGVYVAFGDSPRPRAIDVSEMVKLLERCPNDRLAVEEQDHR